MRWLEGCFRDLLYALRQMRSSLTFTTVAVLMLALGVGVNTAIFSVIDFLMLRPLPVNNPGRLVLLVSYWKNGSPSVTFSYPDLLEIRRRTAGIFSSVSASEMFQRDGLSRGNYSRQVWVSYVTGNFFRQMGIRSALGRFFLPSEGRAEGVDPIVVLGFSYWKSRFNGIRNIVGKVVLINGQPLTVVGVTPPGFHGLNGLVC